MRFDTLLCIDLLNLYDNMQISVQKELELLERLKRQDSSAFSGLYKLHIKKVYAYVISIVKSPALAEDITHDTFVKLWENAENIHSDRSVQAYLFTLARNHSLNTIRRAARETWISEEIIANARTRMEDGLQFTQRRETGRYITEAIDLLPPQRRLIYDLCRNKGYSYKQAAEQLGIKDSTVNSQMVKALRTIKNFMIRNGALLCILFYKF